MEIRTTIVRFNISKKQVQKQTDNAVCFDLAKDCKVWIPLKKMNLKPTDNENFLTVEMPRWVFLKTDLPMYFEPESFDYVTEY